jgi:thiamine kinase-like enzyme
VAPAASDPELDAIVKEVWGRATPTVTPLSAGITNRNYRVDIDGDAFVVRVAGPDTNLLGIDRLAEFEAASAAARAGVAPTVVAFLPHRSCLITRFVEGVTVPPQDLERHDILSSVVAAIRAIHDMPALRSSFDPWDVVADHRRVAEERGVEVPADVGDLFGRLDELRSALEATEMAPVACHNDLLNANLIRTTDGVVIVDYEYAGMNNLFFDLGNFSINNGLSPAARAHLLGEYFHRATPWHEACLELMRIVSDYREAAWGTAQQALSSLDVDYAAYARTHFERLRASLADSRYRDWLRTAAAG